MFGQENNLSLSTSLALLPRRFCTAVERAASEAVIEEIRLRVARPMQLITADGELMPEAAALTQDEANELLERLCMHSVYAHTEQLKRGYITIKGGARVGVCGKPSVENGSIVNLLNVYGFNFRIARQIIGCAKAVMRFVISQGKPVSTIIAAPPGGGKTTLLRDIARCISEGVDSPALKVAIADERSEIAACVNGAPGFDVGRRTDIMDGAPKACSISLLIRSMSPDVIITDEIGGRDDAEAISEACRCGTAVIASAHAFGVEDLLSRKSTGFLIKEGVIKRVLILNRVGSTLHIASASV